jgi:hypothetical protein
MSETETEHEVEGASEFERRIEEKVDKLADVVAGLVDRAHGAAASHEADKLDRPTRTVETTQQHTASLQEEIRDELAKLRKQEAAEQKQADLEKRVAKAEKAAERPPREYKRIHHAMGWVTDADR